MTAPHIVPLLDRLDSAGNVLIAGCGGGFDVYAGMPIAAYLASSGRSVIYANLSFSNLEESGCEKVDPITWSVDTGARDLPYFPERWLAEWLASRFMAAPIYA